MYMHVYMYRAFATRSEDHDHHMTVFPSLRPAGRHEVIALKVGYITAWQAHQYYTVITYGSHGSSSSVPHIIHDIVHVHVLALVCSTRWMPCWRELGWQVTWRILTWRDPLRCVCVCVCVGTCSCLATWAFYRQFASCGKGVHHHKVGQWWVVVNYQQISWITLISVPWTML